jgi:hypothetical protein
VAFVSGLCGAIRQAEQAQELLRTVWVASSMVIRPA